MSTVQTSAQQPAAATADNKSRMKLRSFMRYSWNQNGPEHAAATSSSPHTDTVDRQKGMARAAAACAPCTSPRLAYIPVNPTGASTIGKDCSRPNKGVFKSTT